MKLIIKLLVTLLLGTFSIFGFNKDLVSINAPLNLESQLWVTTFEHRFYGTLDSNITDTFFGTDEGANMSLSIHYTLPSSWSTHLVRIQENQEYQIGLAKEISLNKFSSRTQVDLLSLKENSLGDRKYNLIYREIIQLSSNRITLTSELIYDGYKENMGLVSGIEYDVTRTWSLLSEFSTTNKEKGKNNAFLLGTKLTTFGHQFMIMLHNNSAIGSRNQIMGASSQNYKLGFSFSRLLSF